MAVSSQVLAATKFATQNSDSENDSDSDSDSDAESEDVEDFGSSASEAEEEEASEDLQAQQAGLGPWVSRNSRNFTKV